MLRYFKQLIRSRNAILVIAVLTGMIAGEYAGKLKFLTFPALSLTMIFSMTGISLRQVRKMDRIYNPILLGIGLNYLVFSAVLLPLAYLLMPTKELFYGFVVIAAAPPGVAIIPFTFILKGNVVYSILGVTAAFLSSIIIAPLMVKYLASSVAINPIDLFWMMVQLVIIPLIVSRFLLWKPIKPYIEKVRGKVVDWGFALLIFVAVGLNRSVFFTTPILLLEIGGILMVTLWGLGYITNWVAKYFNLPYEKRIALTMMVGIKSSGFSVFTALSLFGQEAAIPSAVLAVVVLIYLIFLSFKSKLIK